MPGKDRKTEEAAREARNRYYREYRAKNPEKVKAIRQRYWERKAKREQEKEANENKTDQIQNR